MKWNIVHELYPFDSSIKKSFLSSLLFGAFVFLFLFLFEPFGIRSYQHENKLIHLLGYGLVTSTCLFGSTLISTFLFPKWFSKENWTVGKNILYTLWVFFIIGLGNLLYSNSLQFTNLSLSGFIHFQGITVLIGLFPVILSTFFRYNQRLKKALVQAADLNASIHKSELKENPLVLPSKNKNENLALALNELLALRADENYVEVYQASNGEVKKTLLRNTLKEMEQYFEAYPNIQKCHRSYLVNMQRVSSFSGNAQGLSLSFDSDIPLQIPVSRSFVPAIKKQIQSKNE